MHTNLIKVPTFAIGSINEHITPNPRLEIV